MTTRDMLQVILERIINVEVKIASLNKEMKQEFKEVHERLDKQGKQLARLQLPSANSRWRAGLS